MEGFDSLVHADIQKISLRVIEGCMVAGDFLEAALEVIGHELYIVQIFAGCLHISLKSKVHVAAHSHGKRLLALHMIQRLPESLQKQRVIFLIIDMGTDAGQRGSRVLPVDVDAVQAVGFHQRNGADCKKGSSLLGSCRLGETVGSPAAHRQYDLNVRVDLPDLRQIFFISARIPNNPVTLNESESNIDDIQIFNILFFQCSKIFCAYIADYFFHVLSLLLLFLLFHSGRRACTLRSPASPQNT